MKCKIHPTYKAIRSPKRTKKFPEGCKECFIIFKNKKLSDEMSELESEFEFEIYKEAERIAEKDDS